MDIDNISEYFKNNFSLEIGQIAESTDIISVIIDSISFDILVFSDIKTSKVTYLSLRFKTDIIGNADYAANALIKKFNLQLAQVKCLNTKNEHLYNLGESVNPDCTLFLVVSERLSTSLSKYEIQLRLMQD